jgi:anti-sigma28 factor (negative regulator of flagellin synthesis)
MTLPNQAVSQHSFSESRNKPEARLKKVSQHHTGNTHDQPSTNTNAPQNDNPDAPEMSRESRAAATCEEAETSFFNLSPIEDALVREAFIGRFTL